MTDPDIIDALIARLHAEIPALQTVEEAWFHKPLEEFSSQLPAVLPYLARDAGAGDAQTLCPRQPLTVTYGLWLVCRRPERQGLRQALRETLFGWQPSERHDPMQYVGGQLNDVKGSLIWWIEYWSVDTHLSRRP